MVLTLKCVVSSFGANRSLGLLPEDQFAIRDARFPVI